MQKPDFAGRARVVTWSPNNSDPKVMIKKHASFQALAIYAMDFCKTCTCYLSLLTNNTKCRKCLEPSYWKIERTWHFEGRWRCPNKAHRHIYRKRDEKPVKKCEEGTWETDVYNQFQNMISALAKSIKFCCAHVIDDIPDAAFEKLLRIELRSVQAAIIYGSKSRGDTYPPRIIEETKKIFAITSPQHRMFLRQHILLDPTYLARFCIENVAVQDVLFEVITPYVACNIIKLRTDKKSRGYSGHLWDGTTKTELATLEIICKEYASFAGVDSDSATRDVRELLIEYLKDLNFLRDFPYHDRDDPSLPGGKVLAMKDTLDIWLDKDQFAMERRRHQASRAKTPETTRQNPLLPAPSSSHRFTSTPGTFKVPRPARTPGETTRNRADLFEKCKRSVPRSQTSRRASTGGNSSDQRSRSLTPAKRRSILPTPGSYEDRRASSTSDLRASGNSSILEKSTEEIELISVNEEDTEDPSIEKGLLEYKRSESLKSLDKAMGLDVPTLQMKDTVPEKRGNESETELEILDITNDSFAKEIDEIEEMNSGELSEQLDMVSADTDDLGETRDRIEADFISKHKPQNFIRRPPESQTAPRLKCKFPPGVYTRRQNEDSNTLASIDGLGELSVEQTDSRYIYTGKEGNPIYSTNVKTGMLDSVDEIHIEKKIVYDHDYSNTDVVEQLQADHVYLKPRDEEYDIDQPSSPNSNTSEHAHEQNIRDEEDEAMDTEEVKEVFKELPYFDEDIEMDEVEKISEAKGSSLPLQGYQSSIKDVNLNGNKNSANIIVYEEKSNPLQNASSMSSLTESSYADPKTATNPKRKRTRRKKVKKQAEVPTRPITRQLIDEMSTMDVWTKMQHVFKQINPELSWSSFQSQSYAAQIKLYTDGKKILSTKPCLPGRSDGTPDTTQKLASPNTISYNEKALTEEEKKKKKAAGPNDGNQTFTKSKKRKLAGLGNGKAITLPPNKVKGLEYGPPTREDRATKEAEEGQKETSKKSAEDKQDDNNESKKDESPATSKGEPSKHKPYLAFK